MKKRELKELIELLQGTDVTEIEIENEGQRVRIRRGPTRESADGVVPAPAAPVAEGAPAIPPETREAADAAHATIRSPIVGTFYRSPSPETPPFVEVGGRIGKGQVLCIIEAMKLMNEIEAEMDGEVVRILAENGQAVEYGQPLFVINPS